MKVTEELADLLKQACQEVDSWEPWQRSRDPQGSETEEDFEHSVRNASPSGLVPANMQM